MQRDREATSLHPQTTHSTTSLESLLKLRTDSCGVEHQDQDQELHGNSEPAINPGVQDIAAGQDAAAENTNEHLQELDEDDEDEHMAPWYCKRKWYGATGGQSIAGEDVDDEDGETAVEARA